MKILVGVLAALALLAGGCGGSDEKHSGAESASAELERLITRQLPAQVRRLAVRGALVSNVKCIHGSGNSYQCIASVSGEDAYTGLYERTRVPISATCDQRACIWRISP